MGSEHCNRSQVAPSGRCARQTPINRISNIRDSCQHYMQQRNDHSSHNAQ